MRPFNSRFDEIGSAIRIGDVNGDAPFAIAQRFQRSTYRWRTVTVSPPFLGDQGEFLPSIVERCIAADLYVYDRDSKLDPKFAKEALQP